MKALALMGLMLLTLSLSWQTHAQVAGCAAGDISSTGGGVSTCLPGNAPPDEQSQAPQLPEPKWQDRWGAITTDEPHGIVGSSSNMKSKKEAERAALVDCQSKGGTSCIMQGSFFNGCGTLIAGDKTFNVSWGPNEASAAQKGMEVCSKSDTRCSVYFKTCSQAVRIQ